MLSALLGFSVLYIVYKKEVDQFNPLYKEAVVYVVVNTAGKPESKADNIRYRYNLEGYTEKGQAKEITFSASTDLEQGNYVKVVAKGSYTKSWVKVKEEDVPASVLKKLEK